jgi:ribosomal protein L14E/L6E/L27E
MITTVDGLRHGQLVRSIAGRDTDQYYIVFDFEGDHFLKVVDGEKHSLQKLKRKNVKHVKVTMIVDRRIEELITEKKSITDSEIVASIRRLKNQLEEGDRFHG